MATPTYDLITSQTLSSSASTISLTSIPGTYRDLVMVTQTNSPTGYYARLNNDSGSNYQSAVLAGNGSTTGARQYVNTNVMFLNGWLSTGSGQQFGITNFFDYAQTDKFKTALHRFSQAGTVVAAWVHEWSSTSAVTSITLTATGNNFDAGSTVFLYGVAA